MKKIAAVLILILSLFSCSCSEQPALRFFDAVYTDCFDTVCSLSVSAKDAQSFSEIQTKFEKELRELHALFNVFGTENESGLSAVNARAGKEEVITDRRVYDLLFFAKEFSAVSKGTVDPMIGAVSLLWKEAAKSGVLPDEAALREAGTHISPELLVLDDVKKSVRITDPDARIDAGAIAKGYAALLLKEKMKEWGCENYLFSLGGNLYASGVDARTGEPWRTGIRDPRGEGSAVAAFSLCDASLVTSGSYERYFTVGDKSYHHIIDPSTLYPSARTDCVSVSVLHSDPALADALSTALFILPEKEGKELLSVTGGEAFYIFSSGETRRTDGFPREASSFSADLVVLIALPAAFAVVVVLLLIRRKKEKGESEETEQTKERARAFEGFRRRDALLLSFLCVCALLLPLLLLIPKGENARAVVRINGTVVCTLDLDKNAEYLAQSSAGSNLIVVKDGKAYVADADCPGKDCVRCGAIDDRSGFALIACLPHRLTVTIEEGG